jgi:P-type conjugative transfer protein TrbJ
MRRVFDRRGIVRRLGVVAVAFGLALIAPSQPASGGLPVIDISNLVQSVVSAVQNTLSVAQEVQAVVNQGKQIYQQAQQLQHELDMLSDMDTNSRTADTVAWGDLQRILGSLDRAIQTGLSIPYTMSDVGAAFQERFPGYVPPTDWTAAYDSWSTSALDTLRGTLAAAGQNVSDSASLQSMLAALRSSNDSVEGRLQAIQIGNQIASLQVEELAKLRHLFAAQIDGQNAYLGAQEAKAAGSAAAFDAWVRQRPASTPVSRPDEGLGAVPRP